MQRNASVMPINDDVLHLRLLRRSDGHSLFGARRDATASDARQARAEATLARAVDEKLVLCDGNNEDRRKGGQCACLHAKNTRIAASAIQTIRPRSQNVEKWYFINNFTPSAPLAGVSAAFDSP